MIGDSKKPTSNVFRLILRDAAIGKLGEARQFSGNNLEKVHFIK